MFDLDDKIVYPGHGVAVVQEIVKKNVGNSMINFLKLNFLYKDMSILVPIGNIKSIGIRSPSDLKTVADVTHELQQKPVRKLEGIDFTPSGWNRRNKDYQIKIQSGKLIEVAKIYRDLMYVSQGKELSFGEKTLLQSTEDLLVQELQTIRNISRDLIIQEIRMPFKQLSFRNKNFIGGRPSSTQTN